MGAVARGAAAQQQQQQQGGDWGAGEGAAPAAAAAYSALPPPSASALPSTAVTSLHLADSERILLCGCGDGRVVVVADPSVLSKSLATTLEKGLFSLV